MSGFADADSHLQGGQLTTTEALLEPFHLLLKDVQVPAMSA
jgi:hypothetical protein